MLESKRCCTSPDPPVAEPRSATNNNDNVGATVSMVTRLAPEGSPIAPVLPSWRAVSVCRPSASAVPGVISATPESFACADPMSASSSNSSVTRFGRPTTSKTGSLMFVTPSVLENPLSKPGASTGAEGAGGAEPAPTPIVKLMVLLAVFGSRVSLVKLELMV